MKKIIYLVALGLLLTSCGTPNETIITPQKFEFSFKFDVNLGDVVSSHQNGTYEKGTQITLKATPKQGYLFDGFYSEIDNTLLNIETSYTFKLDSDKKLEIKFVEDPNYIEKPNFPIDQELISTIVPGEDGVLETTYKLVAPETYYADFDFSLTGDALRKEIASKTKVKKYYGYSSTSHALRYIDESLKVPGKLYGIYDGKAWDNSWQGGNTWNKEHVWPQSLFKNLSNGSTIKGDIHNLRICTNKVNGSRGNKYFSENSGSDYYFPNEVATSNDDFRGDVARISFYMYAQYDGLFLSNNPSGLFSFGKLDELLEWNKLDPVDDFERQRNMKISLYQGNRNIFIDFPSIADSLF